MAEEQVNAPPGVQARLAYLEELEGQRFGLEEELENKINLLETEYKAKYGALWARLQQETC